MNFFCQLCTVSIEHVKPIHVSPVQNYGMHTIIYPYPHSTLPLGGIMRAKQVISTCLTIIIMHFSYNWLNVDMVSFTLHQLTHELPSLYTHSAYITYDYMDEHSKNHTDLTMSPILHI